MKFIRFSVLSLLTLFFATSCELENGVTRSVNTEEIKVKYFEHDLSFPVIIKNNYTSTPLKGNERVENKPNQSSLDFLGFKTKTDFVAFLAMPAQKENFMTDWKRKYDKFYSLEDEINSIFNSYDNLLDEVEKNYPNESDISDEVENRIDKQIESLISPYSFISYKKENGIDRKTYSIGLDYLLNKDGIVKIEGQIYQYNYNTIKIIEDGDASKIAFLTQTNQTNESLGIQVIKIFHEQIERNGRTEGNISSCTSTEGKYRTIAYEESSYGYDFNRQLGKIDYHIKLRSLKKKTFWWGNHDTGFLHTEGSYSGTYTGNATVNYSMPAYTGTHDTRYHYFFYTEGLDGLTPTQVGFLSYITSSNHTASGKNNTGCSFGK